MNNLYRISFFYATYGIITKDNVVIGAAPIGKWMIGKNIEDIKAWVKKKNGLITGYGV